MKFSFVIPCFNEAANIGRCVESVRTAINYWQQSITGENAQAEILVIDNGSEDDSVAIANRLADRVVECNRINISRLRNQGGNAAQGEFIIFLDGDIVVPEIWLSAIDEFFAQPNRDAVGFVDIAPDDAPWYAKLWAQRVISRRGKLCPVDFLPGRNISVRKSMFDKVGGFDSNLKTGEDKDFIMRIRQAGGQVFSAPSPKLLHLGYEKSFKEWMRKEYWRQHSHIDLISKQGLNPRIVRFPAIALAHILIQVAVVVSLLSGSPLQALVLLYASFLPGACQTLLFSYSRRNLNAILGFSFMYWVRFHVAGISIIRAYMEYREEKNTAAKNLS